MNILVTGGAGFVGSNLIKKLLNQNHNVVSIDNYSTGLKSNEFPKCKYINFDIRNINNYSAYGDFDIVFHLAAIARIQPSFTNPEEYFNTNANATMKLAKYCSSNNIPLIYAGSSSHHSGKFKNPYTFSKDIGEEIIQLFQLHYNLKATITRFYNVYGPYQLLEGDYTTLIGRWINNIKNGTQCEIYGNGEQRRDFTHVDDIVDALILIMEKQAYGYEFELGRGKNYSVNEVAKMFSIEPIYREAKPGEARDTLNQDNTAHEILGWNPQKDLLDYIQINHNDKKNNICITK
jgi:UDP-glucose 4-epimerase